MDIDLMEALSRAQMLADKRNRRVSVIECEGVLGIAYRHRQKSKPKDVEYKILETVRPRNARKNRWFRLKKPPVHEC